MKDNICVMGCGWLGLPLAKVLIENGHKVRGTTTSTTKLSILEQATILPFLIELSSEGVIGPIDDCLSNCKTLILNIPPGLRKNPESDYVQKMKHLLKHIEVSTIEQVVFIGSTSVYDDSEHFPILTESSKTSTASIASKLVAVEALFQNSMHFKTTILRFSGLFSEDRHPATFLSGKTNLKNAKAPVNLIHRNDCIAITLKLLKKNIWNAVLNAATPTHPTKKDYYTSVCNRLNIPIPVFDNTSESQGKIIDSSKLVHLLNYEFKVKL